MNRKKVRIHFDFLPNIYIYIYRLNSGETNTWISANSANTIYSHRLYGAETSDSMAQTIKQPAVDMAPPKVAKLS